MLQLVAQLVAFLVAVIGTFFKCVKEDSHGKPVYSSRGLPTLTTPGKYILTLLVASFVVSAWLTWSSSKDMDDLKGDLREAKKNLEGGEGGRRQIKRPTGARRQGDPEASRECPG